MEASPLNKLPQDTLHVIFSMLPLHQILISKTLCKSLYSFLSSPHFLHHLSSSSLHRRTLLALRPPHHHHHNHHRHLHHLLSSKTLTCYDFDYDKWIDFDLSFLPFDSLQPIAASSNGLLYLWAADSITESDPGLIPKSPTLGSGSGSGSNSKSLVACNPINKTFKVLPQLGSAWSRHGSVLVDSADRVMVLTELAALCLGFGPSGSVSGWVSFSSNLPSKPRSPVLVADSVFTLCDVGSPWRSRWKLFMCRLGSRENTGSRLGSYCENWMCLEKQEWGDIFDIVKRPRLVRGKGDDKMLMIGGLKLTFSLNPSCLTIVILRLDLSKMEWEEAGRMPGDMYSCFQESSKLKVFGGGDRVCFCAKRVGKLAMWEDVCEGGGVWRWIDGIRSGGGGDGLCRGFVFDARLDAMP